MPEAKKTGHFQQLLEIRLAEAERVLASARREMQANSARLATMADKVAAEYERQIVAHKAAAARQLIRNLNSALDAIREGNFEKCAECGAQLETRWLEAFPWVRRCAACPGNRGQDTDLNLRPDHGSNHSTPIVSS